VLILPKREGPHCSQQRGPLGEPARLLGTYRLEDKFLLKVVRTDNQLYGRGTGQSAFPMGDERIFCENPRDQHQLHARHQTSSDRSFATSERQPRRSKIRDAELLTEPDYQPESE
jgi:hypothetical protein